LHYLRKKMLVSLLENKKYPGSPIHLVKSFFRAILTIVCGDIVLVSKKLVVHVSERQGGTVESDQGKGYQSGDEQADRQAEERELGEAQESVEVVPGAPVVRDNTPRPLSFSSLLAASEQGAKEQAEVPAVRPTFPRKAPSAPPLPEELEDSEREESATGDVEVATLSDDEPQEFIWLFEYGPEMDSNFLNSAERLDGVAFLYGPAVLKGYTLMFAEIIRSSTRHLLATIVPSADPDAEAWGVLYRIPRHVTVRNGSQPSLLDAAHAAGSPDSLFRPLSVGVREMYRERELTCGTYALTESARRQFPLLSLAQIDHSLSLVQQFAALARKQKFPEHYLRLSAPTTSTLTQPSYQAAASTLVEQNTEPIPALKEGDAASTAIANARKIPSPTASRLLNVLALYLILVLLLVLTFAVLQGMGFVSPPSGLLVLGVPWLVLVYGLLGACMSSLVSLGRSRQVQRPLFVIILWFARPYLGIVLAALTYLLFNSGLFVVAEIATRHATLLPLLGALAGLCESWFFLRRARGSG
jgi:hypothetical protein